MKYVALFLILLQGILISLSPPKTVLHLLVLHDGQTTKFNSNPHTIDRTYIQKTFRSISSVLGLSLQLTTASKQSFSLEKFEAWAQKIQPNQDLAFVYYSGPQTANMKGVVPSIGLSGYRALQVTDAVAVSKSLQCRNPRL